MRDKNRIFPVVNIVASLWYTKIPDWRFCQLMENFLTWLSTEKHVYDFFYIEDDKFIEFFNEYIKSL